LCRPTPKNDITAKVIASTSGIDSATTRPVRSPSEKKLTSSTIATASVSTRMNSPTDSSTAAGWSATLRSCMPAGSDFCSFGELDLQRLAKLEDVAALLHGHADADRILAHEAHARRRRIGEAAAHVGDVGQAEGTVADADRELADLIDRGELAAHAQRHARAAVSKKPAGTIAFCSSRARCTAEAGTPSVASLTLDSSTQTFSSCTPNSSILRRRAASAAPVARARRNPSAPRSRSPCRSAHICCRRCRRTRH
jgi:hypothetical protein